MQVTEESAGIFAVQLLEAEVCERAIEQIKQLDLWRDAQVLGAGPNGEAVAVKDTDVRAASLFTGSCELEIYKDFRAKMSSLMMPLIKHLWHVEFIRHSDIQIVRYGPGGHYKAHAHGGFFMKERYFTVLCYINDDFEGGGTSFPSLGYCATPRRGKAMLFPARYFHCAEPVVAGEKFIIVSWVLGPVPVEWI